MHANIIKENDLELYSYGFFVLLSKSLFLVLTCFFGILMNITIESVLFYFLFALLRAYAGGVHAGKEWMCLCFTSMAMFFSVLMVKSLIQTNQIVLSSIITLASSAVVAILSPLDSEEKPLTKSERKDNKRKTIVIIALYLIGVTLTIILRFHKITYTIECAIILESILLLLGYIKRITDYRF